MLSRLLITTLMLSSLLQAPAQSRTSTNSSTQPPPVSLPANSGVAATPAGSYDICVYGGSSAGVIAAYTAARMHKTVILIEPGHHLGGLSSGGLGYTDIGNKYAISGLSLDFYRRIGRHYGKFEQWIFEPHVAEDIFRQYIREGNVKVLYGYHIVSAVTHSGAIVSIRLDPAAVGSVADAGKVPASATAASGITHATRMVVNTSPAPGAPSATAGPRARSAAPMAPRTIAAARPGPRTIAAKMFIDCSYEGDLMARAGVSYIVGREANADYDETYDGVQLRDKHQFPDGIDPYKTPGDSASGLLWGISSAPIDRQGAGDEKVQSYNYRICLTNDAANRLPIGEPRGYDPGRYELLLRLLEKRPAKDLGTFLKFDVLPGHKTDINNNGPFSTDMIGMNYDYPEADFATRMTIAEKHTEYVKGLLYFIGHDPRMPAHLRTMMLDWGYPKDEYTDNGGWTPQLYVREARRMKGAYIMTQANCEGHTKVSDGVGLAAYTMDSHNCQRIVTGGMVKNEGDVQMGGFPPYPISYLSLVPKKEECRNLLVPVCLSATHIAYGSIRMEPVFMELGQSTAIAAARAIDTHVPVQEVDAAWIRGQLRGNPLADGSTPEIIVDNDDTAAVSIQGEWTKEKHDSYGFSRLVDNSKDHAPHAVRFTPLVTKAGKYSLYIYTPKMEHPGTTTLITVATASGSKEYRLPTGRLQVEGQTSGEWMPAGKYELAAGSGNYIAISNKDADGVIVADAILLVPDKK